MFPFEKIKPFLVTNEDLKLASLFGRKNRGFFGRKISEISRKKCKGNAKNCLILCHHDSFPKNYRLVIRPLSKGLFQIINSAESFKLKFCFSLIYCTLTN